MVTCRDNWSMECVWFDPNRLEAGHWIEGCLWWKWKPLVGSQFWSYPYKQTHSQAMKWPVSWHRSARSALLLKRFVWCFWKHTEVHDAATWKKENPKWFTTVPVCMFRFLSKHIVPVSTATLYKPALVFFIPASVWLKQLFAHWFTSATLWDLIT